jgi:exopolysaccharide biosynthesis WecB/TagA/CpsF family protein
VLKKAAPEEVDLFGVTTILPIGLKESTHRIAARPPGMPFAYVVTPNAQHVVLLTEAGSGFAAAYRAAWLRLNDSRVLAAVIRLACGTRLPVVNGSDLVLRLLRTARSSDAITVIGGDADLAHRLQERFGLERIALHAPPMGYAADPGERRRCVQFVLDHPARYVFVVTGAPRSECLLHEVLQTGQATGIGFAVGSALDFATGRLRRAPRGMQKMGLEWLFRLGSEPRRLWRRYLLESPDIFALAARAWLRHRRSRPASGVP